MRFVTVTMPGRKNKRKPDKKDTVDQDDDADKRVRVKSPTARSKSRAEPAATHVASSSGQQVDATDSAAAPAKAKDHTAPVAAPTRDSTDATAAAVEVSKDAEPEPDKVLTKVNVRTHNRETMSRGKPERKFLRMRLGFSGLAFPDTPDAQQQVEVGDEEGGSAHPKRSFEGFAPSGLSPSMKKHKRRSLTKIEQAQEDSTAIHGQNYRLLSKPWGWELPPPRFGKRQSLLDPAYSGPRRKHGHSLGTVASTAVDSMASTCDTTHAPGTDNETLLSTPEGDALHYAGVTYLPAEQYRPEITGTTAMGVQRTTAPSGDFIFPGSLFDDPDMFVHDDGANFQLISDRDKDLPVDGLRDIFHAVHEQRRRGINRNRRINVQELTPLLFRKFACHRKVNMATVWTGSNGEYQRSLRENIKIREVIITTNFLITLNKNGLLDCFDRDTNELIFNFNSYAGFETAHTMFHNKSNETICCVFCPPRNANHLSCVLKWRVYTLKSIKDRKPAPPPGIADFLQTSVVYPGFIEFDTNFKSIVTTDPNTHKYSFWSMHTYQLMLVLTKPQAKELRLSTTYILFLEQPGKGLDHIHGDKGAILPVWFAERDSGANVQRQEVIMHRDREITFLEFIHDFLIIKQKRCNIYIRDLGNDKNSFVLSNTHHIQPQTFFLIRHSDLFITFSAESIDIWGTRNRNMEHLYCIEGQIQFDMSLFTVQAEANLMYIYSDTAGIPFTCGPPQHPIVAVRSHIAYVLFGQHGKADPNGRRVRVNPYGPPPPPHLVWKCSDHRLFLENVQRPPPARRRKVGTILKVLRTLLFFESRHGTTTKKTNCPNLIFMQQNSFEIQNHLNFCHRQQ